MNKQITDKTPLTVLVKRKKAFTSVELIVVIAIIAILSTVAVVGYTRVVDKANVSNDTQLVSNLNDGLEIHEIDNKKPQTFHDALTVVEKFGFTTDKIKATSKNNDIVWDMTKNRFSLIDGDSNVIFAESNKTHLWKIYNEIPESSEYSVYLAGTEITGIVNASVGVDVGKNVDESLIINYMNNNEENIQSVVIRTNGGILRIDAPLDSIIHYGTASYVEIINVASSSYKESGKSNLTKVQNGRYIFNIDHKPNEEKVFISSNDVFVAVDERISKVNLVVDLDSEVSNFTYQIVTKTETNPTVNQVVKIEIAEDDTVTYLSEEPESPLPEVIEQKLDNVAFTEKKIAKEPLGNRIAEKIPQNDITDFTLKVIENGRKREINANEFVALDKQSYKVILDNVISTYGFYSEDLFEFTSSNPSVATINKKGEISLLSDGFTTIKVKSLTKAEVTKSFVLHVVKIDSFSVMLNGYRLEDGGTITIEVDPENPLEYQFNFEYFYNYTGIPNDFAIDKSVTYTTDESIFIIDEIGEILLTPGRYGVQPVTVSLSKYGLPITFNIEFKEKLKNDLESKLYNDGFVYKLGNENPVSLSSLFKVQDGKQLDADHNLGIKVYDYLNIDGNGNMPEVGLSSANISYTVNKSNSQLQLSDTIKFTNTGIVVIELGYFDNNNELIPGTTVQLKVEIVKGKNVTTDTELRSTTGSRVILNDISITSQISVKNAYLFGNGYTIDAKNVPDKRESLGSNFMLRITGSTVENLKMIGAVYPKFSPQSREAYNSPLVLVNDASTDPDSYIINCDFSNCAAPLRVNTSTDTTLTIENTVLRGGSYCNLDVIGGNIVFKGTLITINQANMNDKTTDGKTVIGAGIVTYHENAAGEGNVSLNFTDCNLIQYNTISKSDVTNYVKSDYTEMGANYIFNNFSDLVHTISANEKYVNFDIIILSNKVSKSKIIGVPNSYAERNWSYSILGVGGSGYLYVKPCTQVPDILSEEEISNLRTPIEYYTEPEMIITKGINTENGDDQFSKVTFNNKDTFEVEFGVPYEFDVNILSGSKYGYGYYVTIILPQTVSFQAKGSTQIDTIDIINDKFTISGTGVYILIYSYIDEYAEVHYYKTIYIRSSQIKEQLPPEFKNTDGSALEVKTGTDGDFYISFGTSNAITKAGVSIGVKQVSMKVSDNKTSISTKTSHGDYYGLYPVFADIITIIDYDEDGNATTYGANNTNMANEKLSLVGDPEQLFKFASATAAPGTTVTIDGKLYYISFTIQANRNAKNYATNVEYIFTANNGKKYHYFVTYKLDDNHTYSNKCIIEGTMITLADLTQKAVEDIQAGDLLLTWDFETGTYSVKPVVFNDSDPAQEYEVIYATFSDGTVVGIVDEHGFFDVDLGQFVYLNHESSQYIGHSFINQFGQNVTLVDVTIETKFLRVYSPVTFGDLNYYTNGMLSMPGGIPGLFNIFDVDVTTMKYDEVKMQEDIEAFGLLTLEDFGGLITEDMFYAFNGQYLSVAVGKGLITWEFIEYLANRYGPLTE